MYCNLLNENIMLRFVISVGGYKHGESGHYIFMDGYNSIEDITNNEKNKSYFTK